MTVYTTQSYIRYQGDGIQQQFPITFAFQELTNIIAYIIRDKEKRLLKNPEDYTVIQEADTATVLFCIAPLLGDIVVIERNQPQIQTVALHAHSSFDLSVLEHSLDSLVLMIQEASQEVKKLQENGELPSTQEYKQFDEYITKALHTIQTSDTIIEKRYLEILELYEIIKELANNGGGGGGSSEETTLALTEHNMSKISHNYSLVPTGCVSYFASSFAPEGWLILEKKIYSRAQYSELAKVIYCGDENNSHADYGFYCSNPDDPEGSRSTIGEYFMLGPDVRGEFIRSLDNGRGVDTERVLGSWQAESLGSHTHSLSLYSTTLGRGSTKVYTETLGDKTTLEYTGGIEIRPRNIALLACIKY